MTDDVTRRQALAGFSVAGGTYLLTGKTRAQSSDAVSMRFVTASLAVDPVNEPSNGWSYQKSDIDYMTGPSVDTASGVVRIPEITRAQTQQKLASEGTLMYASGDYTTNAMRIKADGDGCLPGSTKTFRTTSIEAAIEANLVTTDAQTTVGWSRGEQTVEREERAAVALGDRTAEFIVQRSTGRPSDSSLPEWRTAVETETVMISPTLTVRDYGEMDITIGR